MLFLYSHAFRSYLVLFLLFPLIAIPNPNNPDSPQPDLMLANVYQPGVDLSDYWVSEKLDGVRAYWDGAQFLSRGGKLFRAPEWFTRGFPREALEPPR